MPRIVQHSYYFLDLLVAFGLPVVLGALYLRGRLGARMWALFWIGATIGLTWEVPIFVLSATDSGLPLIYWVTELPAHFLVFMVAHTLWDGGIFLAGVVITRTLCRPPHFERFKLTELGVLLLWGQVSALLVEVSSTFSEGWVYVRGYSWNPTLFLFNGHDITLLPQVIWAVAPLVFYIALLQVKP